MLFRCTFLLLALAFLAFPIGRTRPIVVAANPPEPSAAATSPASPADGAPDIASLVRQLGDADFRHREAAAQRLKEIGAPAVPALREALADADPEVCSRADSLLRQIERPAIPAGWFQNFVNWRRRESVINDTRVVEVTQGNRRAVISEGPQGVELKVTGKDEGAPVDVTVGAPSIEALRRDHPDAHALYERVAGARTNLNLRGRRLLMPPMPVPMPLRPAMPALPRRQGAHLLPLAPQGIPRPPADDLLDFEVRLRQQMRAAAVNEAEQAAVLDALRLLRDIQERGRAALPQDFDVQMRKYNALSDALRQKMDELKLPDPGDALPPPARARLGIGLAPSSVEQNDDGVTVTKVLPDSRGEQLGLRPGDVIQRVNGKPVNDAAMLRRVLIETQDPLVIDIVRLAEPTTLRERPE